MFISAEKKMIVGKIQKATVRSGVYGSDLVGIYGLEKELGPLF
jgi:hypothetical protein